MRHLLSTSCVISLIFLGLFQDSVLIIEPHYLLFPPPTAEDLNRGYIDLNYNSDEADIRVQVNNYRAVKQQIIIQSDSPFFMPYNLKKPIGHLFWKLHGEPETRYRPLTLFAVQVLQIQSSQEIRIDFRLQINWKDPPANYSVEIILVNRRMSDNFQ